MTVARVIETEGHRFAPVKHALLQSSVNTVPSRRVPVSVGMKNIYARVYSANVEKDMDPGNDRPKKI